MNHPPAKDRSNRSKFMRNGRYAAIFVAVLVVQFAFFEPKPAMAKLIRQVFQNPKAAQLPVTGWMPADSEPVPLPSGTALVRDDGGPISVIVIFFDMRWKAGLSPLYSDLFKKLPLSVEFQVVCADASALQTAEERWAAAERARGRSVALLNAGRPLTMWARDRHLALQDETGALRVTLVPKLPSTADRAYVQEVSVPKLRLQNGFVDRVGYLPYHMEGGNIVSNGRHVFAGRTVMTENFEVLSSNQALREELESLFGRELVIVADRAGEVPFEHLDMYLTPVSEKELVVADLEMGASLLQQETGRKPLMSVKAQPVKQRQLNEIAALLKRKGYTIHRVPAVAHAQDEWMVTYNNVLMERRGGEKIVYMPSYGFERLDKKAAAVYESLGFRVETIDASKVFRNRGTVRCVANVALRGTMDQRPNENALMTKAAKTR